MITYNAPFQAISFEKITDQDYMPVFRQTMEISRKIIAAIVADNSEAGFENTVEALEYSLVELKRLELLFFNINAANTNKEIQQIAQEISPLLSEFYNDITLNENLFNKVKFVHDHKGKQKLSTEQNKLLEETYKNFVRNGANLNTEDKKAFRDITRELSTLSLKFEENLLDETNSYQMHLTREEDLRGLPKSVKEAAGLEAKTRNMPGWVFTLKAPSYIAFMKNADSRLLRENLYKAYSSRCFHTDGKNNETIIKRITALRLKMANLLGYDTYARYVLENRMAETPEKVNGFLDELLQASLPVAKQEYNEVQQFARKLGADFTLQRWDWSYYSEKLREEKFAISDEAIKPYFKLENVVKGIYGLAGRLYGLQFTELNNASIYHPEVKVYEVHDKEGRFLALFYADFFPRESKQGGAWMTHYLEQHRSGTTDNRPHVSIVCNFTRPTETAPSLLTYDEVRTFLHEFGHALHGMLSECRYWSLSGTNVYRDFVELPSQIMENWGEEKEWLAEVAVHYQTGEKIPSKIMDKIIESRNFNNGYAFIRQLSFGISDMAWHSLKNPYDGAVLEFEKNSMAPTELFPRLKDAASALAFITSSVAAMQPVIMATNGRKYLMQMPFPFLSRTAYLIRRQRNPSGKIFCHAGVQNIL